MADIARTTTATTAGIKAAQTASVECKPAILIDGDIQCGAVHLRSFRRLGVAMG
jgi:hypothetical protein